MGIYNVDGDFIPTNDSFYKATDKKITLSDIGYTFDSTSRQNIAMSKYPCANFTSASISFIAPYHAYPYGNTIVLLGQNIQGTVSYLYVGETQYIIVRFDIALDTQDTPDSTSYDKWQLLIGFVSGNGYTSDEVIIVADMDLEDIDAAFIANNYVKERVTSDFVRAVSLAKSASAGNITTLSGKKWLALGDSYTQYLTGKRNATSYPEPSATSSVWGGLADKLGVTLYSYGIASSTVRYSKNTESDGYSFEPMVTRVDSLISNHSSEKDDIGLITFMGGINDPESWIGELESTDEYYIYGALHQIFYKLINAFPNAQIVVILQPVSAAGSAGEEFDSIQNSIYVAQLKQRAVQEVAEFYGLAICDCCFNWYTTANPVHLSTIWQSDKLHLTALGNAMLTEALAETLSDVLTIK